MSDSIVIGFFLLLVGGLQVFRTVWFVGVQISVQKKLMGANYVPSARTYRNYRIFGTALIILGLFMLVRGIVL